MAKKEILLEMVHRGNEEVNRLAERLNELEQVTSGDVEHWEVRDTLAHICEWQHRQAVILARGDAYRAGEDEDENLTNAKIFEIYAHRPWAEIRHRVQTAGLELQEQVQRLSEENLISPDQRAGENGRILWRSIAGNAYLHPMAHIIPILIQRGELTEALRLGEEQKTLTAQLDDSADWQATSIYNQACYLALSGRKAEALKDLAEALRLFPRFADYAPQDTDLVSLHADPDFLALIERTKAAAGE